MIAEIESDIENIFQNRQKVFGFQNHFEVIRRSSGQHKKRVKDRQHSKL